MNTNATPDPIDPWYGYKNGEIVSTFGNRGFADAALERHEVDMIAPVNQPKPKP